MRKPKLDTFVSLTRKRSIQILATIAIFYLLFMSYEIPLVFKSGFAAVPSNELSITMHSEQDDLDQPEKEKEELPLVQPPRQNGNNAIVSGLVFIESLFGDNTRNENISISISKLQKTAKTAWVIGKKHWRELESGKVRIAVTVPKKNGSESCLHSISINGTEFEQNGNVMVLPCGLTLGSHITVVGKAKPPHAENDPKITIVRDPKGVMVSQFIMELQGLKTVDGEDPPRILHFNPRLNGDWSGRPVIEQNTCYRMQWGSALRCEGWRSRADEETVDGQVKCEKWIRDDDHHSEESKSTWWLNRLIGRKKHVAFDWPFPFAPDKLFVLTLSAGLEGYHVNVGGRHITSFPYGAGFALEDATGLSVIGDVEIDSLFAASLPTTHPSFAPQMHLEMSSRWKAPYVPDGPVELFIGILSAGNHFAERMAVRRSWMQSKLITSSKVVARFFVALNGRKEVNVELKKEAEFFGDVVIVPFMDSYDLVVLKTVAICDYGVNTVSALYIMKCDDDTFVRVDAVLEEAKKVSNKSLYVGNINYNHRPLRDGKWAVTYEEWPEEVYPSYANGPGYIISSDIAKYIVTEFKKRKLRLFKMEDVSMGMWVEQFTNRTSVEYVHSWNFCQFGCVEDYYTAHYQSPRQMICMWEKLQQNGKPSCCNIR